MSSIRCACVLLLFSSLAAGQEPPELCAPGIWDVTSQSYPPGGAVVTTRATSTVTCLLDGQVELAEYRDLGPDGTVVFRGISFHVWESDRSARTTLWLMVGDPGHSLLVERMQDGELLSEGTGQDRGGTFLETSTTTFDDDGGYRFEMNRSYDDGATWRAPFNVIEAVRVKAEPPSPIALAPATREAKQAAGATSEGVAVLDGLAEVEARTETVDGRTRRMLRFSARYARPERWRTVEWELGELEIAVEELPINAAPAPSDHSIAPTTDSRSSSGE